MYSVGPALLYVGVGPLNQFPSRVAPNAAADFFPATRTYAPVFLGVCVEAPEIVHKPYWRTLKSDDEGDGADDVQFAGEEADVYAELNWYNETTYAAISARPDFARTRGYTRQADMGALLKRGGLMYPLWIAFPYSTKVLMGGTNAPPVAGLNVQTPGAFIGAFPGNPGAFAAGPPGLAPPVGPRVIIPDGGGLPSVAAFRPQFTPQPDLVIGQALSPTMPSGYRFLQAYLPVDTLPALGTRARRIVLQWHCIREPRINPITGQPPPFKRRRLYDHDMTGLPSPK